MNPGLSSSPFKIVILILVFLVAGLLVRQALHTPLAQDVLIRVPVDFTNLADDLAIASSSPRTIEALVRGPEKKFDSLKPPTVLLSLAGAGIGEHQIPVPLSQLTLPSGIIAIEARPMAVRVSLDLKISRELTVEIPYVGSPAKGFRLAGVLSQPRTVTVSGPQALIDSLDTLRTKPIAIDGLSESCKKEAVFDLDPAWPLILPPGPVTALISIADTTVIKKIDVPLSIEDPSVSVNPGLASIEISGPENRLNAPNVTQDIQITIDVAGLRPGVYVRRATLRLPVDFTLISVKPELFTLTIH